MVDFIKKVNLGSVQPGQLFILKDKFYLRIITHEYVCNCVEMGTFDICEFAPGLIVRTSDIWLLRPNRAFALCNGNLDELEKVWTKYADDLASESKYHKFDLVDTEG